MQVRPANASASAGRSSAIRQISIGGVRRCGRQNHAWGTAARRGDHFGGVQHCGGLSRTAGSVLRVSFEKWVEMVFFHFRYLGTTQSRKLCSTHFQYAARSFSFFFAVVGVADTPELEIVSLAAAAKEKDEWGHRCRRPLKLPDTPYCTVSEWVVWGGEQERRERDLDVSRGSPRHRPPPSPPSQQAQHGIVRRMGKGVAMRSPSMVAARRLPVRGGGAEGALSAGRRCDFDGARREGGEWRPNPRNCPRARTRCGGVLQSWPLLPVAPVVCAPCMPSERLDDGCVAQASLWRD